MSGNSLNNVDSKMASDSHSSVEHKDSKDNESSKQLENELPGGASNSQDSDRLRESKGPGSEQGH